MKVTLNPMDRPPDEEGRLYWRIRGPDLETGKRVTLETGRWTEREALDKLKDHESAVRLGVRLSGDSTPAWTLSRLVDEYTLVIEKNLGEGHDFVRTETDRLAHVVAHLGNLQADRVTSEHLRGYASQRRRDPCRTGKPTARKSIVEEICSIRRAYKTMHDLGQLEANVPSFPSLKAIPEDARPQRRLTEAEVAALIRSAEAEDARTEPAPKEGTASRRVWDLVHARPGLATAEVVAELGARTMDIGLKLVRRGRLRLLDGRWFPLDPAAEEVPLGLATLITVLAWSGRRPIAVFGATRGDCSRVLDTTLPRRDRLMFWARDKGGRELGWGPVMNPALASLVARARELDEAAGGTAPPETLLWRTPQGKEWTCERLSATFTRIAERAKVPNVQPYDLRRFACTKILRVCGGITATARKYTGHKTDAILYRYAFAWEGEAEDLAAKGDWTRPKLQEAKADEGE